ncbi:hypothetical protein L3X38_037784 [Prunus dulcis]|uniref:Integrase catalytic domain-containing protein n=1 Tax=Prunus dulcis TaxID=3755 RepID=A0AAD4V680_PRUDU|nr:hypothetical protein L3X38_037784 [Prunus dulcis]
MVKNKTDKKIKVLRCDNGGEYTSDPSFKLCNKEGISHHFSVKGIPHQNEIAERLNITLLENVRCMLLQAKLPKRFWAEALNYACHVLNRLPSTALKGKTLIELWPGEPAHDSDSLHIFGCSADFHVKENKLDPRAKKDVFMGYNNGVKGFRF